MEKQQGNGVETKINDSIPTLNEKIPKNFLLISYFALVLSLLVWIITYLSESSTQKLIFCLIGGSLFGLYLFLEYLGYFIYIHWKKEDMIKKLIHPMLATSMQYYYYISCFFIAWVSITLSEGDVPLLFLYLIILFFPVFVGKGAVRIGRLRNYVLKNSKK